MVVRLEDTKLSLETNGFRVDAIERIPIGVMTDKFLFYSAGKKYVARCFPKDRGYLAEAEYNYMKSFRERGILCPRPMCCLEVGCNACLIYEYLEGRMLTDVYDGMNKTEKNAICREIVQNYMRISRIPCKGYGAMKGYEQFESQSIEGWLTVVTNNAEEWLLQHEAQSRLAQRVLDKFKAMIWGIKIEQPVLVWSDFSKDNIIVNEQGKLAGFVDLEGLMAADVNLGVGYMQAHENNSEFFTKMIELLPIMIEQTNFYSLLRYLVLLPNSYEALPNGTKRQSLNDYLPYIQTII